MVIQRESQPQIVTLERPRHHYILLFAANGSMLGLKENGDLALCDDADDRVIWDRTADGLKHVTTGTDIAVDLGDDGGFSVKPRGERRLAVRPSGYGYDTSLVVYGKSGAVYPFYLRAESFNSVNVPDLIVRIEGSVQIESGPAVAGFAGLLNDTGKPALPAMSVPGLGNKSAAIDTAIAGLNDSNPGTPEGDFVAQFPFDPNALHGWGEYDLWGDETLRPETVFRDDHFTYIACVL